MCIIFISTNPDPKDGEFRLVIATNRDEFYARPAKEAFLCPATKIIGGRDMEENRENGMWLGLKIRENPENKLCFGCILNVIGAEDEKNVSSRGFLVPNYLNSSKSSLDYFDELMKNGKYNAFNLVNVELSKNDGTCTFFQSNAPEQICKFPGKQVLAFGNSPVNRPLTKVQSGRVKFENLVQSAQTEPDFKEKLIEFLKSKERNLPDAEFEKRIPQYYKQRSSIFVEIEQMYGTRTHSVILVDKNWNVEFYEETMESPIDPLKIIWKKKSINSSL